MAPAGEAILFAVDRATVQVIKHVHAVAYSAGLGEGNLIYSG